MSEATNTPKVEEKDTMSGAANTPKAEEEDTKPFFQFKTNRKVRHVPAAEEQDKSHRPDDHINLKVKGQDGNEVPFRIRRNIVMKKLMKAYCEQRGISINSVVFLFDGKRLRSDHTPYEMNMEDGDEIDAMLHQTGGSTV